MNRFLEIKQEIETLVGMSSEIEKRISELLEEEERLWDKAPKFSEIKQGQKFIARLYYPAVYVKKGGMCQVAEGPEKGRWSAFSPEMPVIVIE